MTSLVNNLNIHDLNAYNELSNIIQGSNIATFIEGKVGGHLILGANSINSDDSISFVTKNLGKYKNMMSILSDDNIKINSNLKISGGNTINDIGIEFLNSNFDNISSGTVIKGPVNQSLFISIEGDDINDSFSIISKNITENQYKNLFCVKSSSENVVNIGVNNENPIYPLDVDGTIKSKEIKISNENQDSNIIFNNRIGDEVGGIYLKSNNISIGSKTNEILSVSCLDTNKDNVGICTSTPVCKLDINGESIRIRNKQLNVPDENTFGYVGEIRWDNNSIYICVDDTDGYKWKHANLSDV
jgi:hypothetical protein